MSMYVVICCSGYSTAMIVEEDKRLNLIVFPDDGDGIGALRAKAIQSSSLTDLDREKIHKDEQKQHIRTTSPEETSLPMRFGVTQRVLTSFWPGFLF